jgi:hypothetical protein
MGKKIYDIVFRLLKALISGKLCEDGHLNILIGGELNEKNIIS